MTCETINAQKAPAAVGPYCHAVKAGEFVFTSGQLGLDPENGTLPEGVEAQADQALINLNEVLKAAGLSLDDVIKTTVFLDDINDFAAINAIYEKRFGDNKPARSCVEVAALPKGALFEIEAIAAVK
ncbi:RidA family protein [Anaerostipes sp.]|uniref:RidA family protein n=1 Tax=Anaerostipes sp. TaxID=1872530 RepID=UPI00399166EA